MSCGCSKIMHSSGSVHVLKVHHTAHEDNTIDFKSLRCKISVSSSPCPQTGDSSVSPSRRRTSPRCIAADVTAKYQEAHRISSREHADCRSSLRMYVSYVGDITLKRKQENFFYVGVREGDEPLHNVAQDDSVRRFFVESKWRTRRIKCLPPTRTDNRNSSP